MPDPTDPRGYINKLIEQAHTQITKLGDALIKEWEKTQGVNLEVLRNEAEKYKTLVAQIKEAGGTPEEVIANAKKYQTLKEMIK